MTSKNNVNLNKLKKLSSYAILDLYHIFLVTSDKAQLGLSHSYSRAKVKFNVNKSDNMIIQSIALLDQLDKDINTFSMRIREWWVHLFNLIFLKVIKDFYMTMFNPIV